MIGARSSLKRAAPSQSRWVGSMKTECGKSCIPPIDDDDMREPRRIRRAKRVTATSVPACSWRAWSAGTIGGINQKTGMFRVSASKATLKVGRDDRVGLPRSGEELRVAGFDRAW